jgi:hypothetical protein
MSPVEELLEHLNLNYGKVTIDLVTASIRDGSYYRLLSTNQTVATAKMITRALIQIGTDHRIHWREQRNRNRLAYIIELFFLSPKSPHRLLAEVEWL